MNRSMHRANVSLRMVALATVAMAPAVGLAQSAVTVEFPDPALYFQNSSFAADGDVGYSPTFDNDRLWSFSLVTGALLDLDGMALAGNASDVFVFSNGRVGIPGWFPDQAVMVVDVSDPTDLLPLGTINLGASSNVQGQDIAVAPGGVMGFVASFPNDTLFSFNVETLSLQDPDGLVLPGNPDRIALAGDRLAMVDTTNGMIMVADIGAPSNLSMVGTIALPGSPTFGSDDNIVLVSGLFGDCADLDGDGVVGIVDLLELLANWGPCPGCPADLNGDDRVGITDFLQMLASWGPCP